MTKRAVQRQFAKEATPPTVGTTGGAYATLSFPKIPSGLGFAS
jgi:hypothetical protein